MEDDTIEINTRELDKFLKVFSGKLPVVRVGVLGDRNSRRGTGTNATIGAKHEFGLDGLPIRSFLRVPLADNLSSYLENSGAFDKDVFAEVCRTSSIIPWLKKVGIVAEQVVSDGFDTGGFGKWKPSIMTHKKVQMTLVETTQLRNSITSDVK